MKPTIARRQVPIEEEISQKYNELSEETIPVVMQALAMSNFFGRRVSKLPVRSKQVTERVLIRR